MSQFSTLGWLKEALAAFAAGGINFAKYLLGCQIVKTVEVALSSMDHSGQGRAGPAPQDDGYTRPTGPARNGLGSAALTLGVVAAVTSWMVIGIPFGIAALAVGIAGRARVSRGQATNRRSATAGMVLGVVAIIVGLVALAIFIWATYYYHPCTAPPELGCH
jgi:lysylphosphatidylglycerol synthetase-like protein (DUF2156 family)